MAMEAMHRLLVAPRRREFAGAQRWRPHRLVKSGPRGDYHEHYRPPDRPRRSRHRYRPPRRDRHLPSVQDRLLLRRGRDPGAAAEERGVNIEALVEAIETLAPRSNTVPVDTGALIDHLLERYHEVHRRQFPEAISLAARVESVHGDNPDCPLGSHSTWPSCSTTWRRTIRKRKWASSR